jgi:hypothetical protein
VGLIVAHAYESTGRRELGETVLAADAELFDQPFVPREVLRMQVVKQSPALADQTQQAAPRMMIFRVRLQMPGQLFDSRREQRDLNFGRTAVVLGARVGADYFPLAGGLERHQVYLLSLFPLFIRQDYQTP